MKHAAFIDQKDGSGLKDRVKEWIKENEEDILEIVDVEYREEGGVFIATITYMD